MRYLVEFLLNQHFLSFKMTSKRWLDPNFLPVVFQSIAGVEAVVHAVRSSFLQKDTEAVLLVDASNVFNSICFVHLLRLF